MKTSFLWYLLTMAGVTYLVRMLPLVLMKHQINNRYILSFLKYIPYTVLAVMTVPAVFLATTSPISAAVGVALAAVLAYRGRSLLTVSVAACVGVYVAELVMRYL